MTLAPYLIPQIHRPMAAKVTLPGSKSIALRQLAMAALTEGETHIQGLPLCDDVDAMRECIVALGVEVRSQGDRTVVTGPMDFKADVSLNARMSGASTRLLLGIAALRSGGHQYRWPRITKSTDQRTITRGVCSSWLSDRIRPWALTLVHSGTI